MYALRARSGLIKPTHRGKTFAFWYKYAADGVEIVPTFIGFRSGHKDKFLEGFQHDYVGQSPRPSRTKGHANPFH